MHTMMTLHQEIFGSGAVKLVKNADIDKYKYSGYGIRFDIKGTFGFLAIGLPEMLQYK